ncbi:hypothetical protein BLNAU_2045 [Blattamonas nauphoetae]|uniref:ISXO2-like transposase domain-containing protein n=1 Tax=Blattamonas nauphoetae TaxID=2049346 RepID=A0ABQ9YGY6_9EUKA|nr:hypothetical protein BLNAU_2045 [Blattamonas nauphoetae]
MKLLLYFSFGISQRQAYSMTGIERHSVGYWFSIFRLCRGSAILQDFEPIGGIGVDVMIDEENKSGCLEASNEMLMAIMADDSFSRFNCHSDEWRAYSQIGPEDQHLTVYHSVQYRNPTTGACTNMIDGLWSQLRRNLPP